MNCGIKLNTILVLTAIQESNRIESNWIDYY